MLDKSNQWAPSFAWAYIFIIIIIIIKERQQHAHPLIDTIVYVGSYAHLYGIKAAPAKQIYRELKMENIFNESHICSSLQRELRSLLI